MDADTARTIQVVAGIIAVAVVTVVAFLAHPEHGEQFLLTVVGSAFAAIGALLGVHAGLVAVRKNGD